MLFPPPKKPLHRLLDGAVIYAGNVPFQYNKKDCKCYTHGPRTMLIYPIMAYKTRMKILLVIACQNIDIQVNF